MSEPVRKPLYTPERPAQPAAAHDNNPAPLLLAMYRRIERESMQGLDFLNPALAVDIAGFRRHRGDWVGAVVTPWFINLFVLPGGGTLWQDLGSGERVKLEFPVGQLEFIADYAPEAEVPAYLYCPLVAPVGDVASQEAALEIAMGAINTLFSPPPPADDLPPPPEPVAAPPAEKPPVDRRAFLRRLVGRG